MADYLTAEEVRAESVAAMPAPLGQLHNDLYSQVSWLHAKWKEFRGLYGNSTGRIELINSAAPAFFGDLQRMMTEDVMLHLCRLTDPPRSAGKDTLTILRLPQVIPDKVLKGEIQSLASDARSKTDFARDWRNRRLAHRELPPPAGQPADPLAEAAIRHFESALAAIRETLNCLERHYLKSSVSYENTIVQSGGIDSLVYYLKKAVDSHLAEQAAWKPRIRE